MWQFDEYEKMMAALSLFQQAIDLDPSFATAYAYQAYCNFLQVVMSLSEDRDRLLEEGKLLAKKAMEIDPRDPVAYFAIGRLHMMQGDHDDSIAALKNSYFGLGFVLVLADELDEARENLKTAIKLSPRDPLTMAFTNVLGMACIMAGDFEEALEWSKRSLRWPSPLGYWNHATLASAYASLHRMDEAREALKGAFQVKPDLSVSYIGMRRAGLPE
jgi:adenylate cyclase